MLFWMETRGRNVAKIELNTDELGYLQTLLRLLIYLRANRVVLVH